MRPTLDCPRDLTVPEPGSATARTIFSQAIGRLLRELRPAVRAQATAARTRDDAIALDRVLADVMRRDAGALATILRRPHASKLLRVLSAAPPSPAGSVATELFAVLAFDLAWLGVLPGSLPLSLRALPPRIVSLVARVALDLPARATGASFANGRVTVEHPGGPTTLDLVSFQAGQDHPWLSRPYRRVEGDIVLALADNGPLAATEPHPDKASPNFVDLGGHAEDEWLDGLREALAVIDAGLPAMRADIALMLQQVVPTGFDAERHLSCSYEQDLGTIYMSLHPQRMTMVEAVIHEVSHTKLNALFYLDPVLENAQGERYASPVRPDLRPLRGVLLAAHAFVPVACLYKRMLDVGAPGTQAPSFRERFESIVKGNHEAIDVVLANARPTEIGKGLLEELARWQAHFR